MSHSVRAPDRALERSISRGAQPDWYNANEVVGDDVSCSNELTLMDHNDQPNLDVSFH